MLCYIQDRKVLKKMSHPLFASVLILLACELTFLYCPDVFGPRSMVAFIHHVFGALKALDFLWDR